MDNISPMKMAINTLKILLTIVLIALLLYENGKLIMYAPLIFSLILGIVTVEATVTKEISIRTFTLTAKDNAAMFYTTLVAFTVLALYLVTDFFISFLKMSPP